MLTYAVMALAALAGGIIQPLTGFGSAVILMVAGQYFFDMTVAPSVAAAICVAQSGVMAWSRRRSIEYRQILPPIALYTACSLVVISLLDGMDLHLLTALFGGFLVLLAVYFLFFAKRVTVKPSLGAGLLCSAFSGCCAGAFTIGGPMMALYFVAVARDKEAYVADMQFLFVTQRHQSGHAGCPRTVWDGVSARYGGGRGLCAGGSGHRQRFEPPHERRRGTAGGLHRRGPQRPCDAAAAGDIG